jgi:hypothetical protein
MPIAMANNQSPATHPSRLPSTMPHQPNFKLGNNMFNRSSLVLLAALAFHCRQVKAALPSFLDPIKGQTLPEEIQCYSIPYGGIGFASHLLTYYTLACLWVGARPLCPWDRLQHTWWDCIVGTASFFLSNAFAAFTLYRCQNRWEFILIAVWKISLSTTLALTTITASILSRIKGPYYPSGWPSVKREKVARSAFWGILYVLGLIVGMTGVGSLVRQTWGSSTIRFITYIFAGICGGVGILAMIAGVFGAWGETVDCSTLAVGPMAFIGGAIICAVLYSDWVLGAIAGSLAGVPSSDIAWMYWGYFAAKRFPMLSF